jgi:hypothetical protein
MIITVRNPIGLASLATLKPGALLTFRDSNTGKQAPAILADRAPSHGDNFVRTWILHEVNYTVWTVADITTELFHPTVDFVATHLSEIVQHIVVQKSSQHYVEPELSYPIGSESFATMDRDTLLVMRDYNGLRPAILNRWFRRVESPDNVSVDIAHSVGVDRDHSLRIANDRTLPHNSRVCGRTHSGFGPISDPDCHPQP